MYKVSINHNGDTVKYSNLVIEDIEYTDNTRSIIRITSKNHRLHTGDYINFVEDDSDQRYYSDYKEIRVIDKDTFTIESFDDYVVNIESITTSSTIYYINESSETKTLRYLEFIVDDHDLITYRGNVSIKETITESYYKTDNIDYKRKCIGDYVLCNMMLYKADGVNKNRKYLISEPFRNLTNKSIYFYTIDGKKIVLGGGNIGNYCSTSKSQNITNVSGGTGNGMLVVPSNFGGKDNRNKLYWCFSPENDMEVLKYILENINDIVFYCKDERFFTEKYHWVKYTSGSLITTCKINYDPTSTAITPSWEYEGAVCEYNGEQYKCEPSLKLQLNYRYEEDYTPLEILNDTGVTHLKIETTTINAEVSNYNVMIPFDESFGTDIFRNDYLGNGYLEREEEKSINTIIDYEKLQFIPYYITTDINVSDTGTTVDDYLYDSLEDENIEQVNKLVFNVHLRKREYEIDEDTGLKDFGEFETSDEFFWNSPEDGEADLLGSVGFTDNDVYYRKKKLKKTFLRMSYYDSMNRGNQKLLGYNTLFLDTGKLYDTYIKRVIDVSNANIEIVDTDFDVSGKTGYNVSLSFETASKYNNDMSSDGFYLYLYNNVISGASLTPIYIKFELNHAKYGKTIALSMPVDDNYIPYSITNTNFPVNYRRNDTTGGTIDIDVAKAIKDTYIKVYVKYNAETNEYVWFLPRKFGSNILTFDLWEPRINGLGDDYDNSFFNEDE